MTGFDEGLDVAIIAMNGRFPGAPDLDRFWRNLRDGVESIRFHSVDELIARGGDPAVVGDPSWVRASAWIDGVDLFDAGFFGFSPREAETMDPQQRVFLELAWEALEQAGYDSRRAPGLTGVYAASGTNEYLFFHLLPHLADPRNVLQLSIGNEKDFLATRVSYELDLRGPSLSVQTGCSSGLVAVHLACQALLSCQCDMALAGGISLQLPRLPGYLYQPAGILSPDGRCRPFSADARGTVAASGAGVVVLKRLSDAIADGDTIRAVIKGSALNNDGGGKLGYTAPSIEGQARVIDMAHAAAAVEPRSITYVEGHGSGTPLGDPIEVAALTRAFRAGTEDRRFCALGSVKSNIGHTDAAAGMAGLIKTVLALEHGEIPPTPGFDRPNPQIDFAESPFYVNRERIAWPRGPEPRRAGVSSFGIGGTNAHVVVEEAPVTAPSSPPRPWDLLVLSARSEAALEMATDRLAEALGSGEKNLSDVAWTLQAGRRRFAHRRVLVCRDGDVADAARALRERDPRWLLSGFDEAEDRPVASSLRGAWEKQPDGAVLLGALGKLWIAGCHIDWAGFHDGERRRRVPLPTYPFERQRYWIGAPLSPTLSPRGEGKHSRPSLCTPWVAPATELERAVAGIWERLLGIGGIGIHDSFFELGGHSLLGVTLVNLAREVLGADLPLEALFETPTVAGMATAVAAARDAGAGQVAPLTPIARTGDLPLSFAQSRMWFLHQLETGSPAYNIPFAVRLTGALDPAALTAAVREIVRRHETLRTTFPAVAGKPVQVIAPPAAAEGLRVPLLDLGGLPPEMREAELTRIGDLAARLPFDLAQGPLLRLALVRLSAAADDHALLLCMHHIISDGWSVGVFVGEMATLYEDFRQGSAPSLPPLPLQYADFADWQSRWLSGETLERHLAWWRERLAGQPAALDLPTDRPRGEQQGSRASHCDLTLPGDLGRALRALAEGAGATPYIVFLAAFDTVLARYARQADVSVGTPIANRTRAEIAGLIGFFVNTLVLRLDVGGDPTFRELVARAGEAARGAYAHQDLPFEKLVEELRPERALAVTPLFQVMLAYQNAPLPYVELPGLTLRGLASETRAAMFDLTLTVGEIGAGGFGLSLEYAMALFDAATADRMLGHLARFLERALADPDRRLSELPMLSAAERDQLLVDWNATAREIADPAPAHHQVLRRAAQQPYALAISGGDLELTYGELATWACNLAPTLRELGAGPEAPVAVFLERSARLVVAELAALLAGAPYLPLDPTFPAERLGVLLEGAGAPVVVTREGLRERLPETGARVVALERPSPPAPLPQAGEGRTATEEADLAYLIFTSGSTGLPKGIEVTHASLTNLIAWYRDTYVPLPGDRAALIAGPSFDVSVGEIWPLLAAGASLHVPDEDTRLSPVRLLAWLARERITLCFLPTPLAEAVLRELPEKLPPGLALRALLTAGDNLVRTPPPGLPFELFDQYGPAEATVFATRAHVTPGPTGLAGPPIGRPITNCTAYVLDPWLEPAPVGISGEIYLGGSGLARGYRGRPDLTAERFVLNPFSAGERLYRTGDLARWLPSGELEFLGRIDRQVKIRGFRIEPGEVEAALARLPGVGAAAVVVRRAERGEARLVAYVALPAGKPAPTALELRRTLRTLLPEYMVPAAFVILSGLPLTPSGKIDRDALPEPAPAAVAERMAPRTLEEEELARIWSDLLGIPFEKVSVGDNFFDLGGHSLLAAQCVARVRETLDAELPLQSLFGNATLGDIADALVEAELASAGEDELRELLAEYDRLSEEELRALLAGERAAG